MNFKEWYNHYWGCCTSNHQEDASKIAWDACKKEIVAIVEKNTNTNSLSAADYSKFRKMIEEIENL